MTNEEHKKTPPNPKQPDNAEVVDKPGAIGDQEEIGQLRAQQQAIDDIFRDNPTPWINGTAIGFLPDGLNQESPGNIVFVDASAPKCERDGIQERVGSKARLLRVSRFIGLQTPNPVAPGSSVGTYAPFRYNLPPVNAGTLGARVLTSNNREYILGSNHVLAHNGRARKDTPITFPGAIDELTAGPVIAKRSDFVPLEPVAALNSGVPSPLTAIQRALFSWPSQGPTNHVDCALAEVLQPTNPKNPTTLLPSIASFTSTELATLSGARINKTGRATQQTDSLIRLFDLRTHIAFTFSTCYFVGLLGTYDNDRRIFAAPGDSGSVAVIDKSAPPKFSGKAVGLITARAYLFNDLDNFVGYIIAMCPMDSVATELEKTMKLNKGDLTFYV